MTLWTAQVRAERKTECLVNGHRFQEREPGASSTVLGLAPGQVAKSQLLDQQTSGAQISAQKGEKLQVMKTLGVRMKSGTHRHFVLFCASVLSIVVLTSDLDSCICLP